MGVRYTLTQKRRGPTTRPTPSLGEIRGTIAGDEGRLFLSRDGVVTLHGSGVGVEDQEESTTGDLPRPRTREVRFLWCEPLLPRKCGSSIPVCLSTMTRLSPARSHSRPNVGTLGGSPTITRVPGKGRPRSQGSEDPRVDGPVDTL